jgi:hypothetical protein
MKKLLSSIPVLLAFIPWSSAAETTPSTVGKPNVVFILADDMGFSDAGCHGGDIATPNLDALARDGLRFSQFYNTTRCWPSRGALLTGYYAQEIHRDALPEDIAKYRDKYLAGWEAMRDARFNRQKEMGIVNTTLSALERNVGPPYAFPKAIKQLGPGEVNRPLPWSELTKEQRRFQATKMAIHAAMADRRNTAPTSPSTASASWKSRACQSRPRRPPAAAFRSIPACRTRAHSRARMSASTGSRKCAGARSSPTS